MCRKLETEEEKVLPFYASSLTDQEQSDVSAVVQEPPTQPLAEVSVVHALRNRGDNFWYTIFIDFPVMQTWMNDQHR